MKTEAETSEAPKGAFSLPVKPVAERVHDAIEAWYGRHYHRATVEGRPSISAADKADLVKAVTEATTTKE